MCRFIVIYKCKNSKKILLDFLLEKANDKDMFPCSYGILWYDAQKYEWNNYKKPTIPWKEEGIENLTDKKA